MLIPCVFQILDLSWYKIVTAVSVCEKSGGRPACWNSFHLRAPFLRVLTNLGTSYSFSRRICPSSHWRRRTHSVETNSVLAPCRAHCSRNSREKVLLLSVSCHVCWINKQTNKQTTTLLQCWQTGLYPHTHARTHARTHTHIQQCNIWIIRTALIKTKRFTFHSLGHPIPFRFLRDTLSHVAINVQQLLATPRYSVKQLREQRQYGLN